MDFNDYQQAILDDISVQSGDAFYTTAVIKRAINRSYKWVCGLRNWPQTEEAYVRDTEVGKNYYNYPSNFKTDSIKRLKYNGDKYTKTVWSEFLNYQEENPTGTDKIFSDHKRQYHINATISSVITDGIELWGNIGMPDDLVNSSDTTLFYGDENIEEAILKKALSILYKKGRGQMYDRGIELEDDAKTLIADAWTQIMKAQGDYQSKDGVVFNRIEVLPTRSQRRRTGRGNFNLTF